MDKRGWFSQAPIPGVKDAAALAAFEPGSDPRTIVLPLSIAASWVYAPRETFREVMQRRGLASVDEQPEPALEVDNDAMFVCAKAYLQRVGDGAILTFRGTPPTNLINWLANATMQKVAFHRKDGASDRGWVHGGFYRNTRAIWPNVVEQLHQANPAWIYITGHSFGGALAVLAAALLSDYADEAGHQFGHLWPRVRGVVTFGQPMVGDETFAKRYGPKLASRLARFVYASDIVPHLPPDTFGWKPVHFGAEFHGNDGAPWAKAEVPAKPAGAFGNVIGIASWLKDQLGLLPEHPLKYSWADHAPNNYIRVSLPHGAASGSEFD